MTVSVNSHALASIEQSRDGLLAGVLLAIVVVLAYLQRVSDFGLYSDDVFLYELVHRHRGELISVAFDFGRDYAGPGRPLGQVALLLLFGLGDVVGGVVGIYLLGGLLLWLQALLAYTVLKRFVPVPIAVLAAATQIVFPADVGRFLPVHSLDSQFAAIALWAAAWLVLEGKSLAASLVMASTLLLYETHWLLGMGLPLLLLRRRLLAQWLWRSAKFVAIYIAAMIPVAAWRLLSAPGRAADRFEDSEVVASLLRIFEAMYLGFNASASTLVDRVADFLANGDSIAWTAAFVCMLSGVVALFFARPTGLCTPYQGVSRDRFDSAIACAAYGLFAWLATYPLYGVYVARFPPTIVEGRLSNVHSPASVGFAFLLAAICALLLGLSRERAEKAVSAIVLGYLSLLVGFFSLNQSRWVENWQYQQKVWTTVARMIERPGQTRLVVLGGTEEVNKKFEQTPFDWTLPYLGRHVMPATSGGPAPMLLSAEQFKAHVRTENGKYILTGYPTIPQMTFSAQDIERFEIVNGIMFKSPEPLK